MIQLVALSTSSLCNLQIYFSPIIKNRVLSGVFTSFNMYDLVVIIVILSKSESESESIMEYSSNAKAPPPLIPVNGLNRYGSYPGADVMDLSATQQAQRQAQQQQNGRTVASSNKNNSSGGKGLVPIPDILTSGTHTPYQVRFCLFFYCK